MDEMILDTAGIEHPLFYVPAAAACLLFCAVWISTTACKRPVEPILPRFVPLPPAIEMTVPRPTLLIDKNLTFVMEPPQTPPPARFRGALAPLIS